MPVCKASLRDLGEGTLEFANNTLTFHVESGVFRRRKRVIREIAITDMLSVEDSVAELVVAWKGDTVVTDAFAISAEERAAAVTLYTELRGALEESKEKAEKERMRKELRKRAEERREGLNETLKFSIPTINALFDILRCLHGRVNWENMEKYLESCEENAGRLQAKMNTLNLDLTTLSSAVKEHIAGLIARETCNTLALLHGHFTELASKQGGELAQFSPNYRDLSTVISANYILNDIILGVLVGDPKVEEEVGQLTATLENLAKESGLKIRVGAIGDAVDRLVTEKGDISEEVRGVFRRELNEFSFPEIIERGLTSEATANQREKAQQTEAPDND